MKNLKLKFTHFGLFVIIALSLFTAACEDNEVSLTCAELDYTALRALYLSTDGDNWTDKTGWPTAAEFEANPNMPAGTDVSTWYGIFTNTEGCVRMISFHEEGSLFIVARNNLQGNIPAEIGNLTQLVLLGITGDELTGNIPPEIGNLTNLEVLKLDHNQLSGTIPPEIGNLTNLEWLELSYNQLSGTIPSEIGNLSLLNLLWLPGNQLTGSIPPEIGNLTNLEWLELSDNQLSGCFDTNLANLCGQLLTPSGADASITDGNNFDASWDDFCATGAGTCTP